MNLSNLDLFGSATAPSTSDAKYARLLEEILTDTGRKNVWKAMSQEIRDDLAFAIEVVARAKGAAYERAHAGEALTSIGWMNQNPALAEAISKLNSSFVDCDSIAMATE
jgi:hypothetical protein